MNVYDFSVKEQSGGMKSLRDYEGRVLLIVNTATECGFTPQYKDLQAIYEDLHADGLDILDFPCDQFGHQAPGTDEDIHAFCTGRFGVTFPQFSKVEVNGDKADPLFRHLTENTRFEGFDKLHPAGLLLSQMLKKQDPDYKNNSSVKWNFTKFLVDRQGKIRARFEPTASAKKVRAAVEKLLKEDAE